MIEKNGIETEKEKVKVILKWLTPKYVQKFLGLANYYKQFIKDFAKITRLLHELTRKEQKWEWEIE